MLVSPVNWPIQTATPPLEARTTNNCELLDFDFGARVFKLLLDGRGFFLVNAFLDGLGCAVNEVLGFFQAEARHFANRLNDVNLVAANVGENDREFRLLFRR